MKKEYEPDNSPEGSAFYSKNILQYELSFIEKVLNQSNDIHNAENEMIDKLALSGEDSFDEEEYIEEQHNRKLIYASEKFHSVLSKVEQQILMMRWNGKKFREIASDITPSMHQSTVYQKYIKALGKLKEN